MLWVSWWSTIEHYYYYHYYYHVLNEVVDRVLALVGRSKCSKPLEQRESEVTKEFITRSMIIATLHLVNRAQLELELYTNAVFETLDSTCWVLTTLKALEFEWIQHWRHQSWSHLSRRCQVDWYQWHLTLLTYAAFNSFEINWCWETSPTRQSKRSQIAKRCQTFEHLSAHNHKRHLDAVATSLSRCREQSRLNVSDHRLETWTSAQVLSVIIMGHLHALCGLMRKRATALERVPWAVVCVCVCTAPSSNGSWHSWMRRRLKLRRSKRKRSDGQTAINCAVLHSAHACVFD